MLNLVSSIQGGAGGVGGELDPETSRGDERGVAPMPVLPHMRRGSRADGALANPVRSGRKQP
jgi:hypothetical protein